VNSADPRRMSVRLPSSIIRIVMTPKWNESPDFAGTKLIGTLGVSMLCDRRREGQAVETQRLIKSRFQEIGTEVPVASTTDNRSVVLVLCR
jgi:hypothetical protein